MLYSPCAEDRSDTTVPGGAFQVADGGWPSCNVRQVDYFNISSDISSVQNRCWWLLNVQYIADCHNPWWGIRLTKYIIWRHQKGFQHCSYVFVCIWWFPEMGSTPKIISFNKTFHEIKAAIIYWGSPMAMETPTIRAGFAVHFGLLGGCRVWPVTCLVWLQLLKMYRSYCWTGG